MKCFRDVSFASIRGLLRPRHAAFLLIPVVVSAGWAAVDWQNVEAGSAVEAALYRLMPMPMSKVLGLRPPKEAMPLLSSLINKQPTAELYSLHALNEESALDFTAAEADWKKYTELSPDRVQAQWALADFYLRRNRPADEIAALAVIGRSPALPGEKRTPADQQRSWLAFERIFKVIGENALAPTISDQNYRAWLDRYPDHQDVYSRYLQYLLDQKSFAEADKLIARYRTAKPQDEVFPVKARALLEYRKGSIEQGLAIYDTHFQPLWPQELIDSYFGLMTETRSLRKFLDHARANLERNPDDLNAAARIFYYYQRQGRTDAAQQTLTQFRVRKEQRNPKWTSEELYTLAKLNEGMKSYPEAARYYYALYNTSDKPDAPELALAGLINVLLEAPEQSIRVGSGELSMYRDIATMDRGPGFLNGILSLVMNSTAPAYKYSEEEQRAVPYFHRAEAAQLSRLFDSRFPASPARSGIHARLIETYSTYGESGAVISEGQQFLSAFPNSPEREHVAMLLADAYARENRTQEEFALYDSELAELARRSDGVPVGMKPALPNLTPNATERHQEQSDSTLADAEAGQEESVNEDGGKEASTPSQQRAFSTKSEAHSDTPKGPQGWYSDFLERYLSRLASMQQVPQALTVLRKEIDRNPNDPGLYERLAQFLEQNRLGAEQEQVYQRAIQQFPDRSWYHKLARFYLRQRRDADFSRLSEQVVKIFSGTELESYFSDVVSGSQYYARLNEFAHARFPHDLLFVRNLLGAYQSSRPAQTAKWPDLMRQHWWQNEDLRNEYFEFLSRTGQLDQELASLRQLENFAQRGEWDKLASGNPVAARFVGEASLWRSHFEDAAPVMNALVQQYPADFELGRRISALDRSLAAFDPRYTELAVGIEENLFKADPGSRDTLARTGDILADRELFERAAPYWDRIAQIRPGESQAYLDTATIYWDYYDYDSALKWLARGREKLGDPALYSYEFGAIYEGQRDYPKAIAEYINGDLKGHGDTRSYYRLIELARRKSLREEVDRATAPLATGDVKAVTLRMDVLEAQNRPKEVDQLLSSAADRATSLETLEWLENTARQKSFTAVQEKALEKQAAVTTDPVRKLELRYSLVRFYESNKDIVRAQRNIDALYRENPKILGVVRSTVDFYWQNKGRQHAVEVLLQAANDSYPDLATRFRFEAAQKATETGQYDLSRKLLAELLNASPYDAEYLAAMADTYARAGDDAGLKKFYLDEIDAFRKAPLTQEVRTDRIAALRRGLIPALTRMKDYAGALDQYIEVINRYPEDDALITEAALYAQRNGRQQQLLTYYANTMKQSPRDYRWPMVLAKTQTQMEDYTAAVQTFAQAINIRPDRVDLRTSRAELLERLMRFDDAAAEYQKLFDLNYHDPRWMEKVAEIRARQGRTSDAVAALNAALIDNRPEKPANYFEAARRLESWGMLQEARTLAQKGIDATGQDLLAVSENHEGAQLYVEIMTRLRQHDAAYARLQRAIADVGSLRAKIAVAVNQVQKNGITSITDQQWRAAALETRRETARTGALAAMQIMGKSVNQYFTPEEKLQFQSWLDKAAGQSADVELANIFLPAADSAELPELQARWLKRLMLANYSGSGSSFKSRFVELQTKRLQFQDLGLTLVSYAQALSVDHGRDNVLMEAANAFRSGGLDEFEIRVLQTVALRIGGESQQRYFQLLLQRDQQQLVRYAGSTNESLADTASQYVVAHGPADLAQTAVAARGRTLAPVWTSAYTGLTGLYFSERTPAVNAAFINALGDSTIGERIAKPADRDRQLTGNTWFYYGSRYGEWLGTSRTGDPEDFLPAQLEESPASASGYITVAEYYADSGKLDRAIDDYNRTLELAPGRADIHDRIAVLYWRQQKRTEAIAEWKRSLELLDAQVHQRVVPPAFWSTFGYVMNHLGNRHITAELRPQSDAVLRDYIRQNGTYQADDLLRSAYLAIGDPQAGVAFMLQLASLAPEPQGVLRMLAYADWIPAKSRNPIYEQMISRLDADLQKAEGVSRQYAEDELRRWQSNYALHLVQQKDFERAATVLQPHDQPTAAELEVRYRIALAGNQFDSIVEQYRLNPDKAPRPDILRDAAKSLQTAGERAAARKLLEFLFTQEIAAHQLSSSNMLGLAEIRLQDGDTAGAMELLRRLTLVVGQPFENLEPAARLLSRNGRHAEAAGFLAQLVKARPWDNSAKLQLAKEQIAAAPNAAARELATAVATDSRTSYADRLAAAGLLSGTGSTLGSAELDFIAYGTGTADKPFFYTARVIAAKKAGPDVIPLLKNALNDTPTQVDARAPLFYALAALKRDRLALSTVQPLIDKLYLGVGYYSRSEERAGDPDEASPDDTATSDSESSTDADSVRSSAEQAALALGVAASHERIGDLESALRYYRAALKLQPAGAARTDTQRNINAVRAAIRRNANNALRMPTIHKDLDQEHTVRPKLLAAAAKNPPGKQASSTKGGVAR